MYCSNEVSRLYHLRIVTRVHHVVMSPSILYYVFFTAPSCTVLLLRITSVDYNGQL